MIAVLVPVLSRPHHVQLFLDSVAVTQEEHSVYFICSPGDDGEIEACKQSGANVLLYPKKPGKADFAKKINWSFGKTDEEWIFQAADDIRFRQGWDQEAFRVARARNARVIGTNDLNNPLVMRGGHSTHTLFRRSYIEDYGSGTFDNSGRVFSERYDHQWVDNEFVRTAMLRGEWAFAKGAIVEHLHPRWGTAKMDSTYEKAFRATTQDTLLYKRRLKAMQQRLKSRRGTR